MNDEALMQFVLENKGRRAVVTDSGGEWTVEVVDLGTTLDASGSGWVPSLDYYPAERPKGIFNRLLGWPLMTMRLSDIVAIRLVTPEGSLEVEPPQPGAPPEAKPSA